MSKRAKKPKSKQQILSEIKSNVTFQKRMTFVRDTFWPALCDASTSVEDATILLEGFNTVIMQTFLAKMKDFTIGDLALQTKLDAMSDKFIENTKLLELFSEMSVFEAKENIEGMRNEITLFQRDEMKTRPLNSLKTKWVSDL